MRPHRITATVRNRRNNGFAVKPAALALEGKRLTLTFGGLLEANHPRYPGEAIWMLDPSDDPDAKIVWIAEGDLEGITQIPIGRILALLPYGD